MSKDKPFKETIFSQALKSQAQLAADAAPPVKEIPTGVAPLDYSHADPRDMQLCIDIARRGGEFMLQYGVQEDHMQATQDILSIHLFDRPLNLLSFLLADVGSFAHDYSRIRRFINRQAGRLQGCDEALNCEVKKQ